MRPALARLVPVAAVLRSAAFLTGAGAGSGTRYERSPRDRRLYRDDPRPIAASAALVEGALAPASWWNPEHTVSGDPKTL